MHPEVVSADVGSERRAVVGCDRGVLRLRFTRAWPFIYTG